MDFINISLKSINDAFYQQYLRLPSVEPVLRNIKTFASLTHIEIVTPIVGDVSGAELLSICDFLADISADIPWHLFKLFPAHQRKEDDTWNFEDIIYVVEQARKKLPYVYFANFPGSKWVHTLCLACGHKLIGRISIGACGSKLNHLDIKDSKCPACGKKTPILMR
jgi:pyruvate-formate lyase-activating enzyme